MKTMIWEKFNQELNSEAKRILDLLMKMYNSKSIVNKHSGDLISSLIYDEYKNFSIEIEMKVLSLLPGNLTFDHSGKYALITTLEDEKNHIIKYTNYLKKNENKDLRKLSKILAKDLINYYKNNPNNKESIIMLIDKYIRDKKIHYDSVDLTAIMMFIQNDIENLGYIVNDINPFKIMKN